MDRRQLKTRNEIFKTFADLLHVMNYTEITIRHIIEGANVGRATFYAHFSSKDELMDAFCSEAMSRLVNETNTFSGDEITDKSKLLKIKTAHLLENIKNSSYKILDIIMGINGDVLVKYLKKEFYGHIHGVLINSGYINDNDADNDFLINYLSSTFFETLRWWAYRVNDLKTEELTERFISIIAPVLKSGSFQAEPDVEIKYVMDRKGSVDADSRIINYLSALEILNQSTDDFLFLFDIREDKNWFFGHIDKDYAVRRKGETTNSTAEMLSIVHPADRAGLEADLKQIVHGIKDMHNMDYRWINRRKEAVWVNCRGKVIEDEEGKPFVMIGRVSEEAMRYLFNPLTGLFNKVKMHEDFTKKITSLNGGHLMLLDIDDLSAINLSHGRKYGDELIKELAAFLEKHPLVDTVYHTELNYFAAWLRPSQENEVRKLFYAIQDEMVQKCTVTAGVIPLDNNLFIDYGNLYDSATITLRNAKTNGKSSIDFFSPEEIRQSIYSVELIEELHESVINGFKGFKVNYQPQVKAGSYTIFSIEALMRYHSAFRGPVYPDEFIPLLEKYGLINPVGMWILEEALMQCKKWRNSIPELRISVNFSTVQFRDKDIVENILLVLKKTNMPGDALTIELTESIPLNEIEHFSTIINRLKHNGIQIAIDDFGTGYSNIGYLKKLDVDEIKIDRMFVSGIEEDTYNYKLISNTIEFAKMNSIRVCCEGVENSKELAVLETLSPDILQGYLFDKPCEVAEFEEAYINVGSEKYKKRLNFIEQLYAYKEQMGIIHFEPMDILRETNVGLWVIRINKAQDLRELYIDETMERILGLDKKYTPRETYDYWCNRIADEHVEYVENNINTMMELDKVIQLQYNWNHPEFGRVEVRSNGRRTEDADGMIVLEGYHRIFSNIEEV